MLQFNCMFYCIPFEYVLYALGIGRQTIWHCSLRLYYKEKHINKCYISGRLWFLLPLAFIFSAFLNVFITRTCQWKHGQFFRYFVFLVLYYVLWAVFPPTCEMWCSSSCTLAGSVCPMFVSVFLVLQCHKGQPIEIKFYNCIINVDNGQRDVWNSHCVIIIAWISLTRGFETFFKIGSNLKRFQSHACRDTCIFILQVFIFNTSLSNYIVACSVQLLVLFTLIRQVFPGS